MKRTAKFLAIAAVLFAAWSPAFAFPQQAGSSSSGSSATAKKKTVSKKHHSRREPTQKAPTAARISEIQSALARNGYYQGEPNGKWDSNTVAAMQKFQSSNGLEASGKLNALSLQKLGLGSSIAGVGAPKPVQPATSKPAAAAPSSTAPASAPPSTNSTSAANSSLASSSTSNSTSASTKPPQR
ncbi:MAG TPA: peptidoglycan-binding domain-containing protein [Candidatus Acidoferrales bacterium]|nr:peptidoglycan-binding domain-containing protein [Candidatus Acidoferrales bacterium]